MTNKYIKDPQAVLEYKIDWSAWLPTGDTIIDSVFACLSDGLTITDSSFDSTSATVWLSGGTVGEKYVVTDHVTTAAGRQDDRSITITIKDL